ncbi:MAG: hypothetical protein DRI46_12800, partial [Chloroflexi bacterium]
MNAKNATSIGRLNQLLKQPFELPAIGPALSKIPGLNKLAVQPGTAFQMYGRFAMKGMAIGAAYKGLEYYDYLRSEGKTPLLGAAIGAVAGGALFKPAGTRFGLLSAGIGAAVGLATGVAPRFDKGLFHGLASYFTDANLVRAEASEAIGITDQLRRQEEITPGLQSIGTGLAFGTTAALGAGIHGYGTLWKEAVSTRVKDGGKMSDILSEIRHQRRTSNVWETDLGKKAASKIAKVPGLKHLTKIKGKVGLAFAGGMLAWAGISAGLSLLSGNPLAAIPGAATVGTTESAEDLQKVYSGEELVPVRAGRWWEFGKGKLEGNNISYYRPHAIRRMETRAFQKGLYDD